MKIPANNEEKILITDIAIEEMGATLVSRKAFHLSISSLNIQKTSWLVEVERDGIWFVAQVRTAHSGHIDTLWKSGDLDMLCEFRRALHAASELL